MLFWFHKHTTHRSASHVFSHLQLIDQKRKLRSCSFVFLILFSTKYFSQMGATAQDIINQTNRQAAIQMGAPSYNGEIFNVQKEKSKQYEEFIKETNNDKRSNEYKTKYIKNKNSISVVDLTGYRSAFNKINAMLSGKAALSMKDAYYYAEAAYGNSYMSKEDYDNIINESADFIKKWLSQNKIPITTSNLQLAIQDFMSNTLSLKIYMPDNKENFKAKTHIPYKYDYEDYEGKIISKKMIKQNRDLIMH